MNKPEIVSRDAWLSARKALLNKEKQFTRERDELSAARREMPWTLVDQDYKFISADGEKKLVDLFDNCSQLLIYHFMFGPDWEEGCPSCSFWADGYNGTACHLKQRDIKLMAISNSSIDKLQAYKARMGWDFEWVSSLGSSFNYDFNVSFSAQEIEEKTAYYNYKQGNFGAQEAPGISVFYRDAQDNIFHTYSCYARGLDMLNGAYHMIDLTPKGRAEADLPFTMAWLRRHDAYPQ